MKKRIMAMLLAVVMIIGLAPTFEIPAMAAGLGNALIDPSALTAPTVPDHANHNGWLQLTSSDSINYNCKLYLGGDMTTNEPLVITGAGVEVTICLCGHTWTYEGDHRDGTPMNDYMITVERGATLNIVDCSGKHNPGYIDEDNKWVPCTEEECDHTEDHVNLTGGVLRSVTDGAGIIQAISNVSSATPDRYFIGTVNFMGGNIAGSTAADIDGRGQISIIGGTFNMVGGTITGNTSDEAIIDAIGNTNPYYGDGPNFGQFNMFGGLIQYNTVHGGKIIYIRHTGTDDGAITLKGGEISNNVTCYYSDIGEWIVESNGIIYLENGILQLWGNPKIINNQGLGIYAMVYMYVSGTPVVRDNFDGAGNPTNLGLDASARMIVGAYSVDGFRNMGQPAADVEGALNEGADLHIYLIKTQVQVDGVNMYARPTEKTVLTYGDATDIDYISCDHNTPTEVAYKKIHGGDNSVILKVPTPEIHLAPSEDTTLQYGVYDDTVEYELEFVDYKSADFENMTFEYTTGSEERKWLPASQFTSITKDYEVSFVKNSETEFTMTLRQKNGSYNLLSASNNNQTFTFYENGNNHSAGNSATFQLMVTWGVFTAPVEEIWMSYKRGQGVYWEYDPSDVPPGVTFPKENYYSTSVLEDEILDYADEGWTEDMKNDIKFSCYEDDDRYKIYVYTEDLVEGVDPDYYEFKINYQQARSSSYGTVNPGKLIVHVQYPGVEIAVDPATKTDPGFDAQYGKEGGDSTDYTVQYIEIANDDARVYWTDASGNELTENLPDANLITLDLSDDKGTVTVTSQPLAAVGTYYFVVEAAGEKSDPMSYTIEKGEFNADERIRMINGVDSTGSATLDISATSGGVFGTPAKSDPADTYFDNSWFDFTYTANGDTGLTINITVDGANIPSNAKTGKIEIPVTGCDNYKDYTFNVFVEPVFKSVDISEATGTLTYGSSSRVTYTVQYNELDSYFAEFAWSGEEPVGMNYQFNNNNTSLIINYSGQTPAGTYPFTISVTEGGHTYSATGNVVINKAPVPGNIGNAVSGKLLYLQNSVLSIDLAEAGTIVTGGTAAVKTNETGWTATVAGNVFTVTNPTEIPENTDPKTIILEVTSQNYETYEITATVIPLYKEVNVGTQESELTYGIGSSTKFKVTNTELGGAPVSITWNGTAPANVKVLLDDVELDANTKLVASSTKPEQKLTITSDAATPAGTYKFIITAISPDNSEPYSSAEVTFTVSKATYTPEDQTATMHYKHGTSKDFTGVVPNDIAENKANVKTDVSNDDYYEVYDSATGKITVSRIGDLPMTAANLENQALRVYVKGGASGNYEDYTINITVAPDFKVLDSELPEVTVPNGTTNILKINNKTEGVSFRVRETTTGFDSGWGRDAELFTLEPLAAGDYIVEACYTGLLSLDDATFEAHKDKIITPVGTYKVKDPAQTVDTIDLYPSDGRFSPSMNEYYQYSLDRTHVPEAEYVYHEAQWKKLTVPGQVKVITSSASEYGISNYNIPCYGDLELTLINVNTTGSIDVINMGDLSLIIDGDVNTGAVIGNTNLVIAGKGSAAKDALTVTTSNDGVRAREGALTVSGLDEFNVETPNTHSIIAYTDIIIGTESAGIGSVNISTGGSTSILADNGAVTIDNVDSLTVSKGISGTKGVIIKNVGTFTGKNLSAISSTGVLLDTIGTVSVADIEATTGAGITVKNVNAFTGNNLSANKDVVFDNVAAIIVADVISTDGNISIKNFSTLTGTGAISAKADILIDGNGDAVIKDGKDTNTATSAMVELTGSISADNAITVDGLKELLIVCNNGAAITGTKGVILTNIGTFGINEDYKADADPVMDLCSNGIVTDASSNVTFTDVDKFTIFVGEKGIAAKNVTMEKSYGQITAVNTSGDEKSVTASGEFLVINSSAIVKSGESKNKNSVLKLGDKLIDEKNVKAVVAAEDVDVYFVIEMPAYGNPKFDVPVTNDENKVDVRAEVSGSNATIDPLDHQQIEELVSDEKAAGNVVIDLSGLGKTIDTAGIPKVSLEAIVEAAEDAGNDTEHLVIKLSTATLTIDDAAMRAIVDQADGDIIKFNFDDVGLTRLNAAQKDAVKDMDVRKGFEAYITVNGKRISDFKGGNVEIIVPYAVPAGENVAGFSVWYIDEEGNPEKLKSTYDGKNKYFVVSHFSDYVIAYNEDDANVSNCPKDETCPIHPFGDTDKQAWYHDGVHFCIENGIMNGISAKQFAPNMTTNRAMIATILWRMEGEPAADYEMTFEDVADGMWYTEAIRWAQSVGVVEGYSAESFGPNNSITREQMATILWRYCKYKGIDVSVGENTNILSYADAFDVSSWAMEAMQWACGSGMIQGIEKNNTMYLDPQGDAVRSQSATMIYRFCEEIMK